MAGVHYLLSYHQATSSSSSSSSSMSSSVIRKGTLPYKLLYIYILIYTYIYMYSIHKSFRAALWYCTCTSSFIFYARTPGILNVTDIFEFSFLVLPISAKPPLLRINGEAHNARIEWAYSI
jgi:hypothetical protein